MSEAKTYEKWAAEGGEMVGQQEFGEWLSRMARGAFEAGVEAGRKTGGVAVGRLAAGRMFSRPAGQQVYMVVDSYRLGDVSDWVIAVNAKGNTVKLHPCERVSRREDSEFFPAKEIG